MRTDHLAAYASPGQTGYSKPARPDNSIKSPTANLGSRKSENPASDSHASGDLAAATKDAVASWQLFSAKGGCTNLSEAKIDNIIAFLNRA